MSDTHIPAALRREVIQRAGNCCEYCHLSQDDNYFSFHVDHIISEKHGGETKSDNLCLSCPSCNIAGADPTTGRQPFFIIPASRYGLIILNDMRRSFTAKRQRDV